MKQLFFVLLLTSLLTPAVFSQKQQLDRETKGLKGKVKSVDTAISMIEESSGQPESTRQRARTYEFDASGNLTVEKMYDPFGDVMTLFTYSYLDGERVVKEEFKSKRMLIATIVPPGAGPTRAPDPRYTAKLIYKYDSNGNRTESTRVYSDGSPPTRAVYTFSGNEREEIFYGADGSLIQKLVYKLDDRGNEVEEITTRHESGRGLLQFAKNYKYLEFDSQGNWTRRMESGGNRSWVIYRKITYH